MSYFPPPITWRLRIPVFRCSAAFSIRKFFTAQASHKADRLRHAKTRHALLQAGSRRNVSHWQKHHDSLDQSSGAMLFPPVVDRSNGRRMDERALPPLGRLAAASAGLINRILIFPSVQQIQWI